MKLLPSKSTALLAFFLILGLCCIPLDSSAKVTPVEPPTTAVISKKQLKRTRLSFKKPTYYNKKPLNLSSKQHPEQRQATTSWQMLLLLGLIVFWILLILLMLIPFFIGLNNGLPFLWILSIIIACLPAPLVLLVALAG